MITSLINNHKKINFEIMLLQNYICPILRWYNYICNDGRDVILNCQWWFSFKLKYNDLINVLKIQSHESQRFDLSQEQVDDYSNS